MFSSKSFIVYDLTFRSLIHFEFIFVYVLGSVLISSFYMYLSTFPAPLIEETVFSPLCILTYFVVDQVTTGVWVSVQAFYSVLLICISVFVPVLYCFDVQLSRKTLNLSTFESQGSLKKRIKGLRKYLKRSQLRIFLTLERKQLPKSRKWRESHTG